jgi:hypothetical protein
MASKILVDELAPQSHATDVTLATGKKIAGANTQYKMTGGASGNIIETDGAGNLSFIAPTVGLSNATQFRLTTDFSGSAIPLTTNWAIVAESLGHGLLGPPVVNTAGTFSYPAGGSGLGYWRVEFEAEAEGTAHNSSKIYIEATTDNSTYNKAAESNAGTYYGYSHPGCFFIQKVSDITQDKVRFNVTFTTATVTTHGDSAFNETYVTFTKLGVL